MNFTQVLVVVVLVVALLLIGSHRSETDASPFALVRLSDDGNCGPSSGGTICPRGTCCSKLGYCGTSDAHCGSGCRVGFGECSEEGWQTYVVGNAKRASDNGGKKARGNRAKEVARRKNERKEVDERRDWGKDEDVGSHMPATDERSRDKVFNETNNTEPSSDSEHKTTASGRVSNWLRSMGDWMRGKRNPEKPQGGSHTASGNEHENDVIVGENQDETSTINHISVDEEDLDDHVLIHAPRSPSLRPPRGESYGDHVPSSRNGVITNCVESGMFALTFDDGPSTTLTARFLDVLKRARFPATFFVLGSMIETNAGTEFNRDIDDDDDDSVSRTSGAALLRRALAEGHQLAAHSWDHAAFTSLDEEGMREQLERTSDKMEQVAGVRPRYFRFPYGFHNELALHVVDTLGMVAVQWNLDTNDWRTRDAREIERAYLSPVELASSPGAWQYESSAYHGSGSGASGKYGSESGTSSFIALAHDIIGETAEALPRVIQGVREAGYRFVTVSECLGDGGASYLV